MPLLHTLHNPSHLSTSDYFAFLWSTGTCQHLILKYGSSSHQMAASMHAVTVEDTSLSSGRATLIMQARSQYLYNRILVPHLYASSHNSPKLLCHLSITSLHCVEVQVCLAA